MRLYNLHSDINENLSNYVTLYHGTSRKVLDSIMEKGILASSHEEWGDTVCAMDSLEKAKEVARYFGEDGIVIIVRVPRSNVEYHPDYVKSSESSEFDTIHITRDVHPTEIIKVVDAPGKISIIRPVGMSLRQWKGGMTPEQRKHYFPKT